MNSNQNNFSDNQDDDLKNDQLNNNDGIGENYEETPLAEAVRADEPGKSTFGSEGGSGWKNNKPGATNEEKSEKLIPTVTPENDNGAAGPKGK